MIIMTHMSLNTKFILKLLPRNLKSFDLIYKRPFLREIFKSPFWVESFNLKPHAIEDILGKIGGKIRIMEVIQKGRPKHSEFSPIQKWQLSNILESWRAL